uniref:Uncharacterized protein n=1 Tax=Rhizophora mucronata TaxID=61149 RepID=A0A2P2QF83_RHIMU
MQQLWGGIQRVSFGSYKNKENTRARKKNKAQTFIHHSSCGVSSVLAKKENLRSYKVKAEDWRAC